MPSQEEMWKIIQQQQQQINALTKKLGVVGTQVKQVDTQLKQTDMKVEATAEATAEAIENNTSNKLTQWTDKTSIGGYGEMHYNNGNTDQIDYHRFVFFVNHEFDDNIRFFSEFELEHGAASKTNNAGVVQVEQAWLEFDLNDKHQAKAGAFLIPVGILNETHEPDTFYGVERNIIENRIIPTTWWEGGAGLTGEIAEGLRYDILGHSGLLVDASNFNLRNSRQKLSEAPAEAGAVTGRIRYNPTPGLELSYSAQYQQDMLQNTAPQEASAWLNTAHINYSQDGFGVRALYARWDIDNLKAKNLGANEQYGYYVEPSYRMSTDIGDVGLFTRYNYYDRNAGNAQASEVTQYDVGLNYWPHANVVLKTDYNFVQGSTTVPDDTIFNLGIGFQY